MNKRYVTERGITVGVMPIPLLLDKIRQAHPDPDLPTYTETLAGGATQDIPITPELAATWRVEDPDGWQAHAADWAAYEALVEKRTQLLNDRLWKAVLRRAIIVDLPVDDAWAVDQAEYGIEVPADPDERRAHYIWTEVLGGQRDVIRIMGMASGADLSEEQLAAAEASFRGFLQQTPANGPADQTRVMGDGRPGGADSGGEGVGAET